MDMSENENMVLFAYFARQRLPSSGAVPVALPSAALFAAFTRWDYNDMPPACFSDFGYLRLCMCWVYHDEVIRKIGL